MIHGIAAGQHDASIFGQLDVFLAEFAGGDVVEFDEFLKREIDTYFFIISAKGVFEMSAGLGCDTKMDLIFIEFSSF